MKKLPYEFLVAVAATLVLRGVSTDADELYVHQAPTLAVYDVADRNAVSLSHIELDVPGEGMAFDANGNLFVGNFSQLDIYDENFLLIGGVTVTESDRLLTLEIRSGQLIACNRSFTLNTQLLVFDVSNVQGPILTNTVNLPNTSGRPCHNVKFDGNGHLWMSNSSGVSRMIIDAAGNPIDIVRFVTSGNPVDVEFQPMSGRAFVSIINDNYIQVLSPADPIQEVANITDICDNAILSPSHIAFTRSGDLYVSCSKRDGATTDLVSFSAASLADLSGNIVADTLNPFRIVDPDLFSVAMFLAIRPSLSAVELLQDLIELVMEMNLHGGISNSLDAKLDAALRALDEMSIGNDQAAISLLQAFMNEVEAQRGIAIADPQADELVATAQEIIALLSNQ